MGPHRSLPFFALLGLLACSSQPVPSGSEGSDAEHTEWSYSGDTGPGTWGQLDPEFLICSQGLRQSPIDLSGTPEQAFGDPQLSLQPSRPHLLNNGHTIEVALAEEQKLSLASTNYVLRQFHFHTPGEHAIEGREFPLEIHFVFQSGERLAVLGVLVAEGEENEAAATFWSDLPGNEGERGHLATPVDPSLFFPENRSQYRYFGSLTTPPCTEGVQWVVFRQPLTMSAAQLESISRILGSNRRPRQSLEGREVTLDLPDSGF